MGMGMGMGMGAPFRTQQAFTTPQGSLAAFGGMAPRAGGYGPLYG